MNDLRCNTCRKTAKPNQESFDRCNRLIVDGHGEAKRCNGMIMLYEEDDWPVNASLELEGLRMPDILTCYIDALKNRNKKIENLLKSGYRQFVEREQLKERIAELEATIKQLESQLQAVQS